MNVSRPSVTVAGADYYDGYNYFALQPIVIIDDIRLAPDKRREFLEMLDRDYVPEVARRGYVFKDAWCFPPLELPGEETDLVLRWELANTGALYRAPRDTPDNTFIADFWKKAAPLIVRRSRRLGRPASDLFARPVPAPVPRPASADLAIERHIVLLRPPAEQTSPPTQAQLATAQKTLAGGADVIDSRLATLHPFSFGADHLVWDIELRRGGPDLSAALKKALPRGFEIVHHILLGEVIGAGVRKPDLRNGFKRALFYKASKITSRRHLEAFEESLIGFPRHIEQLCNWRISRVANVLAGNGWTHILEHELARVEDFTGPYPSHPFHWAVHDRFVQPDAPEYAVPEIWHGFYAIERAVLV